MRITKTHVVLVLEDRVLDGDAHGVVVVAHDPEGAYMLRGYCLAYGM